MDLSAGVLHPGRTNTGTSTRNIVREERKGAKKGEGRRVW